MAWRRRKPRDIVPNPRDKRRRYWDEMEEAQRNLLHALQFLVFALAFLILVRVSYL
jgi:hypothetical protein